MDFIDIDHGLKRRQNYRVFDQDKIPSKQAITEIIDHAVRNTPVKNDCYDFRLEVYGPKYKKEKEELLDHTICLKKGDGRQLPKDLSLQTIQKNRKQYMENIKLYTKFRKENPDTDEKKLQVVMNRGCYTTEENDEVPEMEYAFNTQVLAPWLIKFTYAPKVYRRTDVYISDDNSWKTHFIMATSMVGYSLAIIANQNNIDASFCQCVRFIKDKPTVPLFPDATKSADLTKNFAFFLGLGHVVGDYGRKFRSKPYWGKITQFK